MGELTRSGDPTTLPQFTFDDGPLEGFTTDDEEIRVSYERESITAIGPPGTGSCVYEIVTRKNGRALKFSHFG